MAVAEYITKVELDALEKRLTKTISAMETRIKEACAEHSREQADRVIEAISHGTNPNF